MSISPETSASWRRSTRDHAPLVLRRLLALLHSPILADADLNELAILAENAVESTYVPGDQVLPGNARLPSVHHVLEGRVELAGATGSAWTPRMTVGLLEVLAGRTLPAPAVAATEVRTLELDATDMFEILEESVGLLTLLLRSLAARAIELPSRWEQPEVPAPRPDTALGLVDRMILIRRHLPLYAARMQPLTFLAHAAREVTWAPGEIVAHVGSGDRDVCIVLEGAVTARRDGEDRRLLGPGAAFGALEVLAGCPFDHTFTAVAPTRALALAPTTILDVLEDHPELGLAIAANLAARILDEPPASAAQSQSARTRGMTSESNS